MSVLLKCSRDRLPAVDWPLLDSGARTGMDDDVRPVESVLMQHDLRLARGFELNRQVKRITYRCIRLRHVDTSHSHRSQRCVLVFTDINHSGCELAGAVVA